MKRQPLQHTCIQWWRPIRPSYSVQESPQNSHSYSQSPGTHGGHTCPFVFLWIIPKTNRIIIMTAQIWSWKLIDMFHYIPWRQQIVRVWNCQGKVLFRNYKYWFKRATWIEELWMIPFYNVETGDAVLTAYSVQITTQDSHSHTCTTSACGGYITAPLISLRIISEQKRQKTVILLF